MNSSHPTQNGSHPYLRAATTGVCHHIRCLKPERDHPTASKPVDRPHLDLLHTHLAALHQLLDQLADAARPPYPAAGRHLASARTRLWQATAHLHDAFHTLPPLDDAPAGNESCHPERVLEGPPFTTICRRHLASTHTARHRTTPADLKGPPHGHTTHRTA